MNACAIHIDTPFEVAPEQASKFKEMVNSSQSNHGSQQVLARAAKFADLSKIRVIRTRQDYGRS